VKVYIVGAGAVGTWFGRELEAAGCEIIYAPRKLEDVVAHDAELAIVAVKAFDTDGAVATLSRGLTTPSDTCIVSLQNGIGNEEKYAVAFGRDCVVAGALTVPVERDADGTIRAANRGGLGLAPLGAQPHNWLIALLERTKIPVRIFHDARALKWSKLALNIIANASCAILDMEPAELVRHPQLFALELACLRELQQLFVRAEITPVDLPRYPVRAMLFAAGLPNWAAAAILAPRIAKARGGKPPSLLIDLRNGRNQSEVGALNGIIAQESQREGLDAPVNAAFARILEAITVDPTLWERYRGRPDALLAEIPLKRSM
jgi:2-dehydropantoate 2-reductase